MLEKKVRYVLNTVNLTKNKVRDPIRNLSYNLRFEKMVSRYKQICLILRIIFIYQQLNMSKK